MKCHFKIYYQSIYSPEIVLPGMLYHMLSYLYLFYVMLSKCTVKCIDFYLCFLNYLLTGSYKFISVLFYYKSLLD